MLYYIMFYISFYIYILFCIMFCLICRILCCSICCVLFCCIFSMLFCIIFRITFCFYFPLVSGHYMYTESSKGERGDEAKLSFPEFNVMSDQSVRFYYHMHGRDIGTLKLTITDALSKTDYSFWNKTGDQSKVLKVIICLSFNFCSQFHSFNILYDKIIENGCVTLF